MGTSGCNPTAPEPEVENATVDSRGVIIGLTQREALELDQKARSSARLANVLFGVAGATAIAGGTLWCLASP